MAIPLYMFYNSSYFMQENCNQRQYYILSQSEIRILIYRFYTNSVEQTVMYPMDILQHDRIVPWQRGGQ